MTKERDAPAGPWVLWLCLACDAVLIAWTAAWWWPTTSATTGALARIFPWAANDCQGSTFLGILPALFLAGAVLCFAWALRWCGPAWLRRTVAIGSGLTVIATLIPWLYNLATACVT